MNIKVISDSKVISQIILNALKAYSHDVELLLSREIQKDGIPMCNFFIIDSKLDQISAEYVTTELLQRKTPPHIIGINTKGTWKDKMDLITSGVETVLNYPFPMQELIARIKVLENKLPRNFNKTYSAGELRVEPFKQAAYLCDKPLKLRRKEYNLLTYLVKNKYRAISRSELLDNIWDYKRINNSNTVDVHINRLRDKLGDKKNIKTIYGYGYQLREKIK